MIQGGMGIAAGGNIEPGRRLHVRADRRHGARPHGQGHDQPARRDRCGGDAAALSSARRRPRPGSAAGSGSRTERMTSMRAGEMGYATPRGRRPRRGGCRRHDGHPRARRAPQGRAVRHHAPRRRAASRPVATRSKTACGSSTRSTSSACPFIEGGWPGANPRDTEFFRLATKETLQHAALTSFGMTRQAGERRGGERGAPGAARTRARRSCASSARRGTCTSPRRSGRTWTRASRWCATRSRSCARRAAGCSSMRNTSSTATGRPGVRDARARGGRGVGRRATGPVRHERRDAPGRTSRASSREVVADRRADVPLGHPRPQRRRVRGGELARRRRGRRLPGAGTRERVRRAHRQRRPDPDRGRTSC